MLDKTYGSPNQRQAHGQRPADEHLQDLAAKFRETAAIE